MKRNIKRWQVIYWVLLMSLLALSLFATATRLLSLIDNFHGVPQQVHTHLSTVHITTTTADGLTACESERLALQRGRTHLPTTALVALSTVRTSTTRAESLTACESERLHEMTPASRKILVTPSRVTE